MIHRKWTPVELTVLLQVYYNREYNNGLPEAPSYNNALAMWTRTGYIERVPDECMHTTTDRGEMMMDALCSVPGWWAA